MLSATLSIPLLNLRLHATAFISHVWEGGSDKTDWSTQFYIRRFAVQQRGWPVQVHGHTRARTRAHRQGRNSWRYLEGSEAEVKGLKSTCRGNRSHLSVIHTVITLIINVVSQLLCIRTNRCKLPAHAIITFDLWPFACQPVKHHESNILYTVKVVCVKVS